jgi:cytochrome c2
MSPAPPPKPPDRHYDFGKMNQVFAWSSAALFVITVLMVFFDYRQPWKRFQSEFRDLERQKLAKEAESERQRINQQEVTQLRSDIGAEEQVLAQHKQEIAKLDKDLAGFKAKVYAADASYRQTKSLLDTARFHYEEATQLGDASRIAKAKKEVDELAATLREQKKTLEEFSGQRDRVAAELAAGQAKHKESEDKLAALQKGVDTAEKRIATLSKNIDYFLLNAPLMDFLQPSLKVEQVMLPGLYHDINFTKIDRVDRCMTCHVATRRAGFDGADWKEPLRSHPRLDLFVGDTSPHPYGRFGCTICHGGLDRATEFSRAGHSPSSAAQQAEWQKTYGWQAQQFLDTPIMPAGMAYAGCVSCHAGAVWTPQGEVQETGRELVTHLGCYGCHKIDLPAYEGLRKAGPSLRRIAGKTSEAWAYKWVEAPRDFHPTTWMPHFFFQENIQGDLNKERQRAEIRAAVSYLWDKSEKPTYAAAPAGDAASGKHLFETVGCTGCHLLDGAAKRDDYFPQINRMHGPNLIRTGSKVSSGWLYAWVKNPKQYFPDTNMPNLRLTDQEAADVVAYLMSSRDPAYENLTLPGVDGKVRDDLVTGYLQATDTIEQSAAKLAAMPEAERDVFLGQATIAKYGCYGCHDIQGFETAKPIGTELSEEGSKPLHLFDFGHVHDVPLTRPDWIRTKLLRPRVWDEGKELVKDYGELYKMPNFGMSEREANAVLTNVLGFTKESVVTARRAAQRPSDAQLADGRKLVTRFNCQGCHLIEGEGQAIKTSITDPGLLPPNLAAEGSRVQSGWLFAFLHDPSRVRLRPWLTARMPTFGFTDEQLNTLVAYFAARDRTEPFLSEPQQGAGREVAVGQVVFGMLQCAKCHPAGPDAAKSAGGSAGDLAPSLLLAHDRLRHDWVPLWIRDPQSFIPGTRMPSFFPSDGKGHYQSPLSAQTLTSPAVAAQRSALLAQFADEAEMDAYLRDPDKVTQALRDYVWSLGTPARSATAP